MTQEQKAKAYDEALIKAKELLDSPRTCFDIVQLKDIIPELRESEDERIRKEAISIVQSYMNICDKEGDPCLSGYKVLDWLEKQKNAFENGRQLGIMQEQARQELEWPDEKQKEQKPYGQRDECKDCQANYAGSCKGSCEMKRQEQKPADEQFPPLEGLDAIKAEYYDRGFKNGFDEGVDSVKPMEWSEFDKGALKDAICATDILGNDESFNKGNPNLGKAFRVAKGWLKSLPERFNLQLKQEWTDEDQKALKVVTNIFMEHGVKMVNYPAFVHWLKNLPKRFTLSSPASYWKPSEEQMRALIDIICFGKISYVGQEEELIALKNQLKKLM